MVLRERYCRFPREFEGTRLIAICVPPTGVRDGSTRRELSRRDAPRLASFVVTPIGATPSCDSVVMTEAERIKQLEDICHAQQVILDHHTQLLSQLLTRSGIGAGTHIVEGRVTSGMDAARRL